VFNQNTAACTVAVTPTKDHSDGDRGEGGVGPLHAATTTSSRATFFQLVELAKDGLSYMQVADVMSLYREIFAIVRSTHKPMTRQLAAQYVRIVAASGLESLRRNMQATWSYPIAADVSAQIHGTAYYAIRIRLASVDRKTTSLVNIHLVAPPLSGAHSGKSMYNLTASVLTALDRNWRKKLLGANSEGARIITGCYSGWRSRLANSCAGGGPFYRIHCSSHRVNLVNGREISALRETGSG
jgi:hypothetical protein